MIFSAMAIISGSGAVPLTRRARVPLPFHPLFRRPRSHLAAKLCYVHNTRRRLALIDGMERMRQIVWSVALPGR